MIDISFYNCLATNTAENLKEQCGCLVELKCIVEDNFLGKNVISISCKICKKEFPETMKNMNEKIHKFSRGLWLE